SIEEELAVFIGRRPGAVFDSPAHLADDGLELPLSARLLVGRVRRRPESVALLRPPSQMRIVLRGGPDLSERQLLNWELRVVGELTLSRLLRRCRRARDRPARSID